MSRHKDYMNSLKRVKQIEKEQDEIRDRLLDLYEKRNNLSSEEVQEIVKISAKNTALDDELFKLGRILIKC